MYEAHNKGTRVEYQISIDRDGVLEEDKYEKYMKVRDQSVDVGGVIVEMINNTHLDGKSIHRSIYKLIFRL